MKRLIAGVALVVAALTLAGCSEASTSSHNLSKAADNFEIDRRVVFLNGITDTYLLSVEGRCSIEESDLRDQLAVTCKTGDSEYKKHFLGLSDNVSYFVEQLEPVAVDGFHYRVIFRPETIVPDFDLVTSN